MKVPGVDGGNDIIDDKSMTFVVDSVMRDTTSAEMTEAMMSKGGSSDSDD